MKLKITWELEAWTKLWNGMMRVVGSKPKVEQGQIVKTVSLTARLFR